MISIRNERPRRRRRARGAARRGLRRNAAGARVRSACARAAAGRRPRFRRNATASASSAPPAVDVVCGTRRAGTAARARGGRHRLPQPRHRRGAGAPCARRRAPARPPRHHPGRRRAPITAASASRPRRPARLRMPGPFERHRLLALELVRRRARRRPRPGRAPAGPPIAQPHRSRRLAPHNPRRISWTPRRAIRAATLPFALCGGYDPEHRWRRVDDDRWPVHARIDGPIVMIGFGSIGKGTLPLIERHFSLRQGALRGHRSRGQGPQAAGRARHPLHPPGGDQGQLPGPADAAAHRRRRPGLLRQPVGRHLLARHHGALQRDRRALHRHRRSSPGPAFISTQSSGRRRARIMRCARPMLASARASAGRSPPRSPAAAPIPAWCPGSSSRRCSISQATPASSSRSRRRARNGPARQEGRRQGHPHRRARHPARQATEAAGRVRQHLVGRRLHVGRHAAGRTRLGHA